MAGNVSEWTQGGDGKLPVFRGGSFESYADRYVEATTRDVYPVARYYHYIGFRCARSE